LNVNINRTLKKTEIFERLKSLYLLFYISLHIAVGLELQIHG